MKPRFLRIIEIIFFLSLIFVSSQRVHVGNFIYKLLIILNKQQDETSQINTSRVRHEPLLTQAYKYSRVEESCGVIRCDFFRRKVNVRRKLQATLSDISPPAGTAAHASGK